MRRSYDTGAERLQRLDAGDTYTHKLFYTIILSVVLTWRFYIFASIISFSGLKAVVHYHRSSTGTTVLARVGFGSAGEDGRLAFRNASQNDKNCHVFGGCDR